MHIFDVKVEWMFACQYSQAVEEMRNKSHAWLALSVAHSFERVPSDQFDRQIMTNISHYKGAVIEA